MSHICLITPHHISFQPRTLREADSLYEAGHDVRVVFRQTDFMLAESDTRLLATRKWHFDAVDLRRGGANTPAWFFESIHSACLRKLFMLGFRTDTTAAGGYLKGSGQLMELAIQEKADCFIAHTHAALPLAAACAKRWNAQLGFDCEDLLAENGTDPPEIVRLIEKKFLPLCHYVTVPSKHIGNQLVKDYGVPSPIVLYNVFPRRLNEGLLPPRERSKNPVIRLHWLSQTLGPRRGIEEAIVALGMIPQRKEFYLRGRVSHEYRLKIESWVKEKGGDTAVIFSPIVDYDQVIKPMDLFDIGLALEQPDKKNASQTVSNKLFSYLLAGLAIAATDTPGQREIMEKIPSAGFLYPPGKPQALARGLERWMNDRNSLCDAQQAAWDAARERFCWDLEKEKLFKVLFR